MRQLLVGLVVLTSGCDLLFQLDAVDRLPIDATVADHTTDTPLVDAGSDAIPSFPLCSDRRIDNTFPSTSPCSGLANAFSQNTTMVQGNGMLLITPTGQGDGGCSTGAVPFTAGGVIAKVTSTVMGQSAFTGLNAIGANNPAIAVNQNRLKFQAADASSLYTSMPYVAADMVWWRLRPSTSGEVIAEYSADAVTWHLLGVRAMTVPTSVTVEVLAGVADASTFNGTATFERLIVCN